jgi:heme-degrading monooxygenase HmoA
LENGMSDFQDFLRQPIAYVAIGEFKSGKFPEAKQIFDEVIATYSVGFRGAYLLQEEDSDRGVAIIFWDNAEAMAENQTTVQDHLLQRMGPLFVKAPETRICDIVTAITV